MDQKVTPHEIARRIDEVTEAFVRGEINSDECLQRAEIFWREAREAGDFALHRVHLILGECLARRQETTE